MVEIDDVSLDKLFVETKLFQHAPIKDRPVLLLELIENEVNPRSYISTLLQPSNRDVYGLTKEFEKAGATYMLINPPTLDEVCEIACLETEFGTPSVFKGMSRAAIIETVTKRVKLVGPILRAVFQSHDRFNS